MTIFQSSRYEGININVVVGEDGKARQQMDLRIPVDVDDIREYEIQELVESKELDLIAAESYNDARFFWVIAESNNIDFIYDVEVGTPLLIPTLSVLNE